MGARAAKNEDLALPLERTAELLEEQAGNRFRIAAYRRAARRLQALPVPVEVILERGGPQAIREELEVGEAMASAIAEIATTGRLGLLERLEGHRDPEHLLSRVPGIGAELAERIHQRLRIETLEDLEAAAHDGSLESIPGIGADRAREVRDYLADYFGRQFNSPQDSRCKTMPPVALLLDVDREYRERAEDDRLPRIAPQRFNPKHETWLPVWHTHRGDFAITALFSNSARAHDLGHTRDWVVIVCERAGRRSPYTVVTETHGPMEGERVVRGREAECLELRARAPRALVRETIHAIAERLSEQ